MAAAADENGGWKFAQCFGDKGNQDEITEGRSLVFVVHYFAEGGGERRAGTTPEEGGRRPPSVAGFISFWVGGKSQALANTLFFTSYPQQTYTKKKPADIISTVEFDSTGHYLATGDKGGRVVLFERDETVTLFVFLFYICVPTLSSLCKFSSSPPLILGLALLIPTLAIRGPNKNILFFPRA